MLTDGVTQGTVRAGTPVEVLVDSMAAIDISRYGEQQATMEYSVGCQRACLITFSKY